MPRNKSVVIWGDGAVGKGLAVALSSHLDVFLAGPSGSGRGSIEIEAVGAINGKTVVKKIESGDHIHCDYCVAALKAYDLKDAAESIMKSTDKRCICLTNGMGLEDEWGESWKERIEPAILTVGFGSRTENFIETTEGDIIVSAGGRAFDLFQESSLNLIVTEDMEIVRWSKWLANSVINPLGALSGLRNNELIKAGLETVADTLFTELASVIPEDLRIEASEKAGEILDFLFESSSNRCSMLQDILAGRRTEIDFLTGLHDRLRRENCPAAAVVTDLIRASAPSRSFARSSRDE